jgi:hypothetical protein
VQEEYLRQDWLLIVMWDYPGDRGAMQFDPHLELPALLRSWREHTKPSAVVLRDWAPRRQGVFLASPQRPLDVPRAGYQGVDVLEQKVDEGRRIVVDLEGSQLLYIPDSAIVDVLAIQADELGTWKAGDRGLGYLRHDVPEMVICWLSGARTEIEWPDRRIDIASSWRTQHPGMSAADGSGPAHSASRDGNEDESPLPRQRVNDSQRAVAAVVSKPRKSQLSGDLVHAFGITLPKGCSGQQAEALAGWTQLSLARHTSKLHKLFVCWVMFDSLVVVSLIKAAHGFPLKAVYRELGPWVRPYELVLNGWEVDLWILRMTSHSLSEHGVYWYWGGGGEIDPNIGVHPNMGSGMVPNASPLRIILQRVAPHLRNQSLRQNTENKGTVWSAPTPPPNIGVPHIPYRGFPQHNIHHGPSGHRRRISLQHCRGRSARSGTANRCDANSGHSMPNLRTGTRRLYRMRFSSSSLEERRLRLVRHRGFFGIRNPVFIRKARREVSPSHRESGHVVGQHRGWRMCTLVWRHARRLHAGLPSGWHRVRCLTSLRF